MVSLLAALLILAMLPVTAMANEPGPVVDALQAPDQTLEVLNPFAEWGEPEFEPPARLSTLDGKTIGILNPVKSNSTFYADALEEILKAKYPNIKFKYFAKQPVGDPAQMFREGPDRPKEFVWAKHWKEAVTASTHYHNRSNVMGIKNAGVDAVIHAPSL